MKKTFLILSILTSLVFGQLKAQTWSAVGPNTWNTISCLETYSTTVNNLFVGTRIGTTTYTGEVHVYSGPTNTITSTQTITNAYSHDMTKSSSTLYYITSANSFSTTTGITYGSFGTGTGGLNQIASYNGDVYRMPTGTIMQKTSPAGTSTLLTICNNVLLPQEAKNINGSLYMCGRISYLGFYYGLQVYNGTTASPFGPTIIPNQYVKDFTSVPGSGSVYVCLAGLGGTTCGLYKYDSNGAVAASITGSSTYTSIGRCEIYKNKLYYSVQTSTASANIYVTDTMLSNQTLLATIVSVPTGTTPLFIKDMIVYNDELYIGGTFIGVNPNRGSPITAYNLVKLSAPVAGMTVSTNTVCGLGTVKAVNTSTNSSNVSWYVNGVLNGSSDTITVSPSSPFSNGTLTISIAVGDIIRDSVSQVVSVLASPVASISVPSSSICAGSIAILTAANGGYTYSWSTSSHSRAIAVSMTGVYSVTVTSTNGCTATATQPVYVRAPLVPVITQVGTYLTVGQFSTYQWELYGSVITGATLQTYTPLFDGDYSVRVTDSLGCIGTSSLVNYTVDVSKGISADINKITQEPTYKLTKVDGVIFISFTSPVYVEVYELTGKLLYSSTSQAHEIHVGEGMQVVRSELFVKKVGL